MKICNRHFEILSVETGINNKANTEHLKLMYRQKSKIIKSILNNSEQGKYLWIKEMNEYFSNIHPFLQNFKYEDNSELIDISSSIIHMHINRIFRTKQRINECVIYYLLFKHYNSMNCFLNSTPKSSQ